jgi:hypothetical protein
MLPTYLPSGSALKTYFLKLHENHEEENVRVEASHFPFEECVNK